MIRVVLPVPLCTLACVERELVLDVTGRPRFREFLPPAILPSLLDIAAVLAILRTSETLEAGQGKHGEPLEPIARGTQSSWRKEVRVDVFGIFVSFDPPICEPPLVDCPKHVPRGVF